LALVIAFSLVLTISFVFCIRTCC